MDEELFTSSCITTLKPFCGPKATQWIVTLYMFLYGRMLNLDGFTFSQMLLFSVPPLYLTFMTLYWVLKYPKVTEES